MHPRESSGTTELQRAGVLAPDLQHIEGDEHRRRAQDCGVGLTEEMEPAHELLVEDRDLAVEHEHVGPELRDRPCELPEAHGVVNRVAGDQTDASAVLVGKETPTVNFSSKTQPSRWKGGRASVGAMGTRGKGTTTTAGKCTGGRSILKASARAR